MFVKNVQNVSLVEIQDRREKKKVIKLVKTCDREINNNRCYIELNKIKKSAAKLFYKLLCSSGKHERYLIYYLYIQYQIMYRLRLGSAIVSFFIVY